MTHPYQVTVLAGSLRKDSYTRRLARGMMELAPAPMRMQLAEIGHIAFYNADLEQDPPPAWRALREQVQASDGVLWLTPEYNRSVPAVLKNALDVLSRPWGQGVLGGKPAAIVSVSPGALGGFGANHHLRQALVGAGAVTMGTPEAYIGAVDRLFSPAGELADAGTRAFLRDFLQDFARWLDAHRGR